MAVEAVAFVLTVFFVLYFCLINGSYLLIHAAALWELRPAMRARPLDPFYEPHASPFLPGIAILVPAYNEAPVIADSVQSLLNLEYGNVEVVVVNDGSTDDTLEVLRDTFDLQPMETEYPIDLPSEDVREIYAAPDVDVVVIDKENGGKADALNAGLFFTDQPLFCAVDADTVIERGALLGVVKPFLRDPERVVATGGTVHVANGCTITNGVVRNNRLASSYLAGLQTMEYLRAFFAGRVGLGRLRSLLIISGAFGVFRTQPVREVDGYSTETITEDLELVVRLHRHLAEQDRDYRIEFRPEPAVWTEVPESLGQLHRQRGRWYRGLLESLVLHRDMIGRRQYGIVGLVALPFFLLVETLGPLIEGVGYLLVPILFLLGLVNTQFFLVFLAIAVGLGTIMSWLGIVSDTATYRRYDEPWDVLQLLGYGILENVVYRQWKAYVAWRGFVRYLRGDTSWGEMSRIGFQRDGE